MACAWATFSIAAVPALGQTVLYSNYGPADTYATAPGASTTFGGYGKSAARFVASAGGEFDRVETTIVRQSGFPVSATVSISPEVMQINGPSGGVPSVMSLWCATASNGTFDTRTIVTFTGPRATLVAGQAYWIVIEATESTTWYQTSPPILGTTASKTGSPWWNLTPSSILPAFRVSLSGPAPGLGACCNTFTGGCVMAEPGACATLGLRFGGAGVTCAAAPACVACPADYNRSGDVGLQDIFDFLAAWFAGCP